MKNNNVCSATLCVTHNCNLNCIYCYQKHDYNSKMNFETAKNIIDCLFTDAEKESKNVEINFIGGEPLLEFSLIKKIVEYAFSLKTNISYKFFATTNGTLLTEEMKKWFSMNCKIISLGLSLDGDRDTQNYNRSNSFEKIDFNFFKNTWKNQSVKMTLSSYSLQNFAHDVKFIHSLGFSIMGSNLAEGDFDWGNDEYLKILAEQLKELSVFYTNNDKLILPQMFNSHLELCETKPKLRRKYCGIGEGTIFYDVDGQKYPCAYTTPMTFNESELEELKKIDYTNSENFIDDECFHECYIYPICRTCAGACFKVNKTFNKRIKSRCKLHKLMAVFAADIQANRIIKNPDNFDKNKLPGMIKAIKNIKNLYLKEFIGFL